MRIYLSHTASVTYLTRQRNSGKVLDMSDTTRSRCCASAVYIDNLDGRTCCTICDTEVDPKSGRPLTPREQDLAWQARTEREEKVGG